VVQGTNTPVIDPPAIAAVRVFLTIVCDGAPPSTVELASALDRLIVAVHDAPDGEPADEEVTPPQPDYGGQVERLRKRYPGLTSFPTVWPLDSAQEVLTTTADDALADIIGDLNEIIWRYENVSASDAYWHLHLLFLHHWGVHARELGFYLHFLLRERGDA
jgi:hypothetical protein